MSQLPSRTEIQSLVREVTPASFAKVALVLFAYQSQYNPIYARYMELLGIDRRSVRSIQDIPYLPISLFKRHLLQTGIWEAERIFTSSGTTASQTSQHLLRDAAWYRENARRAFAQNYGPLENYCFLALLPAYLERTGSSLVYMAQDFISQSRYSESGFFLNDFASLTRILKQVQQARIPSVLLGVSFALWDLAEQYPQDLSQVIVMETGGMKGRRQEIIRTDLHRILQKAFHTPTIHSEYGMTELLSQAYSKGNGLFYPAPTMRVATREITDPLQTQDTGRTGLLNVIDLANLDTISFIATDDLAQVYPDGSFRVQGRLDAGDVRGCNLLYLDSLS